MDFPLRVDIVSGGHPGKPIGSYSIHMSGKHENVNTRGQLFKASLALQSLYSRIHKSSSTHTSMLVFFAENM